MESLPTDEYAIAVGELPEHIVGAACLAGSRIAIIINSSAPLFARGLILQMLILRINQQKKFTAS